MFTFIETVAFSRALPQYLSDEEFSELQAWLNDRPKSGAVIPGSGGVRKLRWAERGRGARGGLRVIYYLKLADNEIWLLTVYGKSAKESIPPHILRKIKEAIESG